MSVSGCVSVVQGSPELALPLVCDSPHSGAEYPHDFGHAISFAELRTAEDTHVDQLWSHAPQVGATLIAARFPRSYIDANRALTEVDPSMLGEPWPDRVDTSLQLDRGKGLIWRHLSEGKPIYARKLSAAEVRRRIDSCWRPYHDALDTACRHALDRWGMCWHLNLHSMPHDAYVRLGIRSPRPLADFVLGDLHGKSCDAEFVAVVKRAIEVHGYSVSINDPYAGQELLRLMGAPQFGRHSLQVEINRSLYMNEATREPNAHFDRLRRDLASVLHELSKYLRRRCRQIGA